MKRQRGFTLIEIMVVMVVVGLMAVIAVVNLGSGAEQRELDNVSRQMFMLMETASEQAVLNNQEFGMVLGEEGYRFVVYNDLERKWQAQGERLFQPRAIPLWLVVTPRIEDDIPKLASGNQDDDGGGGEDEPTPDLVFFSSGEITPFELGLGLESNPDVEYLIESDGVNGVEWHPPGEQTDDQR
ncbi:type II secretion system minor pseudopilin GspH [Marinobacter sp. 1Y8]